MEHYRLVEFMSNLNVKPPCTNVKIPRTNVKPPIDDISGDGSGLISIQTSREIFHEIY